MELSRIKYILHTVSNFVINRWNWIPSHKIFGGEIVFVLADYLRYTQSFSYCKEIKYCKETF